MKRYNLVIIGTGTAAMVAAMRVRAAGWSVAVIDFSPFGGTCALRGCDPKKMLVGGATAADHARRMHGKGIAGETRIDWPALIAKDGRRFSPDYMLIINDAENSEMYYQCLIEPKGGHLLEKDTWKEEVLISLDDESQIVFDADQDDSQNYVEFLNEVKEHGYKEVKCLGFKFYNTEPRSESDFAIDFHNRMPS